MGEPDSSSRRPPLGILREVGRSDPEHDVALGPVLLREGLGDAEEIIRIHTPAPTAAFSRRDTRQPGFHAAASAARALGFVPVIRPQGGQLAAYHRGSVVIDHVVRGPNPQAGLVERFRRFSSLHALVLEGFGLDARVGELAEEYCPGEFSVNAGGRVKIVGSAQRVTRDGWLFSSVIQVSGSEQLRQVLEAAYREIGYQLDPRTVGTMEDFVPGVTATAVADELRRAYTREVEVVDLDLTPELSRAVEELARSEVRGVFSGS